VAQWRGCMVMPLIVSVLTGCSVAIGTPTPAVVQRLIDQLAANGRSPPQHPRQRLPWIGSVAHQGL